MRFDVNPVELHRELSLCRKVMGGKPAVPALENFLLELDGDVLVVTGSDSENTVRSRMKVRGDGGSGRMCVDGARLYGLLPTLREGTAEFTYADGTLGVRTSGGSYTVQCIDADGYPLPSTDGGGVSFRVGFTQLSSLFGGVSYAMSRDTLRAALTGTLIEVSEGVLTAVATDANVLSLGSVSVPEAGDVSCIVPARTVGLIAGMNADGDVDVRVTERNIVFSAGGREVIARVIDARYPNYKAVVPKENPMNVSLERLSVIESLNRMMLFAGEGSSLVVFSFGDGVLRIHADGADCRGSASDSIPCSGVSGFEIGFNARKMIDVLKNIQSDRVVLGMSEPNRPAVVVPEGDNPSGVLGLCMPCII